MGDSEIIHHKNERDDNNRAAVHTTGGGGMSRFLRSNPNIIMEAADDDNEGMMMKQNNVDGNNTHSEEDEGEEESWNFAAVAALPGINVIIMLMMLAIVISIAALVLAHNADQNIDERRKRELAQWGDETNILPQLSGYYIGKFVSQGYVPAAAANTVAAAAAAAVFDIENDDTNSRQSSRNSNGELLPQLVSDDRPILVVRNKALDRYVAYEFNQNTVSNIGSLELPRYKDELPTAILQSGTNTASWEHWVIKDNGRTIESTFLYQTDDDTPMVLIGTYRKFGLN